MTHRKAAAPAYFKALTDEAPGRFEAIVAVFNNIDLGGDRILPGAFANTLEDWRKSGDPIPVIFSHQWDNLDAHVGTADPALAKELSPGDAQLPPELKDLGGLYIKGDMDVDEPFAGRLFAKMQRRSIREFSFAYDIPDGGARANKDVTDLLELELIEVGPTLKGLNPSTALLGTNARKAVEAMSAKDALDYLDGLVSPPPPGRAPEGAKRLPMAAIPAGAVEETQKAVRASASLWAQGKYGRDLYALHLEATYIADGKALVTAERWEDPWGEGPVWELSWTMSDDGATITNAVEQEVTVAFSPASSGGDAKARLKAALDAGDAQAVFSAIFGATAATFGRATKAKAEEPDGAKAEEPSGEALLTMLELEELSI